MQYRCPCHECAIAHMITYALWYHECLGIVHHDSILISCVYFINEYLVHYRCPCDECTIAHMITCGIISPEVQDAMATHHHEPGFTHDPSRYVIDFTPPSMSSTSSSSRSCSPVPIDTPHHKKIHAGSGLGGATSNSILQQHTHSMENWG